MSPAQPLWDSTESTDRPMSLALRLSNSGLALENAPSSVVQTGVKSLGWENRIPQLSPSHSWKLIVPSVVSAVKSERCRRVVLPCGPPGIEMLCMRGVTLPGVPAIVDTIGHICGLEGRGSERTLRPGRGLENRCACPPPRRARMPHGHRDARGRIARWGPTCRTGLTRSSSSTTARSPWSPSTGPSGAMPSTASAPTSSGRPSWPSTTTASARWRS